MLKKDKNLFKTLVNCGNIVCSGEDGMYTYSGLFLNLFEVLDYLFVSLAKARYVNLKEERYPSFIKVSDLNKIQYFKKLPSIPFISNSLSCNDENVIQKIIEDAKSKKISDQYFRWNDLYDRSYICNPSTCYHTFINRRNTVNNELEVILASSMCSRNEKMDTGNPMRLKNFTMRECVFIGSESKVELEAEKFFQTFFSEIAALVPEVHFNFSNDIFFGENGETLGQFQLASQCKKEMYIPIAIDGKDNKEIDLACMSRNLHNDFLCKTFNICNKQHVSHSACVAMGTERLAYAILYNCGLNVDEWNDCQIKDILKGRI